MFALHRLVVPLLMGYDHVIEEMTHQITAYKVIFGVIHFYGAY